MEPFFAAARALGIHIADGASHGVVEDPRPLTRHGLAVKRGERVRIEAADRNTLRVTRSGGGQIEIDVAETARPNLDDYP